MQRVNKIIIAHLVAAYILPFTNHRKQNKLDYRENIKFGIWLELGGFRLRLEGPNCYHVSFCCLICIWLIFTRN